MRKFVLGFQSVLCLCKNSVFLQIGLLKNYSVTSSTSHLTKLYEKSFTVFPGYGKLLLNSKSNCVIQPASPEDYPDANYASITVWGEKNNQIDDEIEAEIQDENNFLKFDVPCFTEGLCEIYLPMKYDVEASLDYASSIQLEKLEGDYINVTTKEGSIKTKDVKCKEILLETNCGSFTAEGVLQGNVRINAKKMMLKAQRLQGLELCIEVGNLETEIESSYMDRGRVYANRGRINIKNLHGSTDLHLQTGTTSITGLTGSLQAIIDEGDGYIQVSRVTGDSLIQVNNGDLTISLSNALSTSLDVSSPSIAVPHDIERLGEKFLELGLWRFRSKSEECSCPLKAHVAKGCLKLETTDWFSSLGIKSNTHH